MSYKKVYSQGDFGVGKTEKQSANFGFVKKKKNDFVSSRIVDLSEVRPGVLSRKRDKKAPKKRGRKKKKTS